MCTTWTQTDDASTTMCTTWTQTDDASTTMCTTETRTDDASTTMCTTETRTDDASTTMCTTWTQTDDASTTMCTTETQTDDASSTMCTTETQIDATESNIKEEVPPEDCTSMSSRVHTDAHNQEQPEQQIEEVVEEEAEAMVAPMRSTMVLRSSNRHKTKISSLQQIFKPIKNKKMATQYLKKIINPMGCRGFRYSGKEAQSGWPLGVEFRALSSLPTEHLLQEFGGQNSAARSHRSFHNHVHHRDSD